MYDVYYMTGTTELSSMMHALFLTILLRVSPNLLQQNTTVITLQPTLSCTLFNLPIFYYLLSLSIVPSLFSFFFFFNDPAPPEISPLPLPAALPIPRPPNACRAISPAAGLIARTLPALPCRFTMMRDPPKVLVLMQSDPASA